MNKVIRRLKKIMGFEGEPEPILKEGQKEVKEKVVKPKPTKVKAVKEAEENQKEKLEKELEELKKTKIAVKEPVDEAENKPEEQKLPTTDEVLLNHEQRILQLEAKFFRLAGI